MSPTLLTVKDLTVRFQGDRVVQALSGVSFELAQGETLGLLGESGSGKSVTLRTLLRLHTSRRTQVHGKLHVDGQDVLALEGRALARYRGGVVSMVFQEPGLAFDPVYTIGSQMTEMIRAHDAVDHASARTRALQMLERVQIPQARKRLDAGAAQRILPKSKQKKTITRAEVEDIVAKIARIPPASVNSDDRSKLKTLDRDLKSVVFGQDPAIDALAAAIKMARSGLGKPEKPIGSFLFSGPTGVGKTEVAKQLAYILGIELIRFDMSEYMERHAVSRLIGAPPGYVGFDQGGLLTEAVTKKPHCVLLLDEIEKAHPDVFNVLLQVMDHGTLTDNNGRKADFRNVIIIMTTNAGAETMQKATIGFTTARESGDEMGDIKRMFTPEFRNRLDAIVSFRALDEEIILRVVDKFLLQLESQLAEKKVEVTFTDKLRKHLGEKGFDPLMGARPMQRLIQDTIRRALADELLFGRLTDGGRLTVDLDDKSEVTLDIEPRNNKSDKPKSEPATA